MYIHATNKIIQIRILLYQTLTIRSSQALISPNELSREILLAKLNIKGKTDDKDAEEQNL